MSARIARRVFTATTRRSMLKPGLSSSTSRVTCRDASTSSESSHGPEPSSDKPWIIGSLLIFGSAFLYLISPSARSRPNFDHKNKHVSEHSKEAPEPEPVLMKDDEGTAADVASSIALAESSDVPNDAQSDDEHGDVKAASEEDSLNPIEQNLATTDEGEKSEKQEEAETVEGDRKLPKEPTVVGEGSEAAVGRVSPKEGARA